MSTAERVKHWWRSTVCREPTMGARFRRALVSTRAASLSRLGLRPLRPFPGFLDFESLRFDHHAVDRRVSSELLEDGT